MGLSPTLGSPGWGTCAGNKVLIISGKGYMWERKRSVGD